MNVYQLGSELKQCAHVKGEGMHVLTLKFGEECPMLETYGITDLSARVQEDITFCKAETHHRYIEGNLCIPNPNDISGKRSRVLFFLTKDYLAFVDNGDLTKRVIDRARANLKDLVQSREKLLYDYFALLLDNDAPFLLEMESRIFRLEEDVTANNCKDFRERSQEMRKNLLILREYYSGISDIAEELEENDNGVCDEDNLTYFGIISGRADRLENRANRLLEFLSQVQTEYNDILMEIQNKNMNYLSVISTIFLPLTLITGWFGMNFQNMPELENGYPWVIAGSLLVAIIVVIIFKKKKML